MREGLFGLRWFWKAVLGLAAVTTIATVVIALADQSAQRVVAANAANSYSPPPLATTTTGSRVKSVKLTLSAHPRVLFLGDSWTEGYGASKPGNGVATRLMARLGWTGYATGIGGTGYLSDGPNHEGTYLQRLLKVQQSEIGGNPDLVVVQGSINDDRKGLPAISAAVADVEAVIHNRWPSAQVLFVLPFTPYASGTGDPYVSQLDVAMQAAVSAQKLAWISPIQEAWTTPDVVKKYINPRIEHPTDAGYDYFTGKLATAVQSLSQ